MSIATGSPQVHHGAPPVRRVRHQAREVVLLMAFSAATSALLSGAALLLLGLAR